MTSQFVALFLLSFSVIQSYSRAVIQSGTQAVIQSGSGDCRRWVFIYPTPVVLVLVVVIISSRREAVAFLAGAMER